MAVISGGESIPYPLLDTFLLTPVMISSCCSAPDFVRTLEDETYVYFFFREQAVEYINCGKVGSSSPVIVMLYHNIFSYMDVYPQVFSIITI